MYNFKQHLLDNEKILYIDKPAIDKYTNPSEGLMIMLGLAIITHTLLMWSLAFNINNEITIWKVIFISNIIFELFCIYIFFYNAFLKKKIIANDEYCLTNMRVFKYVGKSQKIIISPINNFKKIKSINYENDYGDVVFKKNYLSNSNIDKIVFISIKSPSEVVKMIKTQ